MLKKYGKSIIILFAALFFLSRQGNDPLIAKWRVTGDTMGEGVPVFIAISESKDKSLTFSISYNTGEGFPSIEISSTGSLKFQVKPENKPDKAVIIFSSGREHQFNAFTSGELAYWLNMNRKELDALAADLKKEKQFSLSVISEDNNKIILNRIEFDLDNAYNAIQEVTDKYEKAMLEEADFIFPDSDKRILNKEEMQYLSVISKKRLQVARNEIFARHGYIFSTKDMTDHFSKKNWYKPLRKTINLSEIEKKNIELIKAAEKK